MFEFLKDLYENIVVFDIIYLIITLLSLIKCLRKGFVLSLLEAAKWLLAYVITLILFPRIKPYVDGIIDNEYVLDIVLGIGIFVVIIFIILLINKALSKAVTYSGIGTIDKFFGFLFGFAKAYVVVVCLYTVTHIVYNHDKWPMNLDDSFTFTWVEKGSNYLIKEFPDEKEYKEAKEKVQDI